MISWNTAMTNARVRDWAGDTSEENLEAADGTTRTVAGPWEGIAAHQRAMRERAELENARLRASLQAQLRLAKSLERLLRKRPSLWVRFATRMKAPGAQQMWYERGMR